MKLDSLSFVRRHRRTTFLLFYLGLGLGFVRFHHLAVHETTRHRGKRPTLAPKSKIQITKSATEAFAALPLSFEANAGQVDRRVKFLSRASGYTVFLTADGVTMALRRQTQRANGETERRSLSVVGSQLSRESVGTGYRATDHGRRTTDAVLRLRLVGTTSNAAVRGLDQLPGRSNYFLGNDPNKWRTDMPTYAKVRYENVYPGVDLVYYGSQRQLEYDFVLSPGADPSVIALDIGAALVAAQPRRRQGVPLQIDGNGDLLVKIDGGEVRFHKPVVYQPSESRELSVASSHLQQTTDNGPETKDLLDGKYVLKGNNRVAFEVAAYDRARPLVIDPVLVYSTFLGGSLDDLGEAIAIDSSGDAYITGSTLSTNFPTTLGAFQTACKPSTTAACSQDAFVAKIKADGSALVYSTYLGGAATDSGHAIAVDGSGNAYIAGRTSSPDFPTTATALQKSCDLGVLVLKTPCFYGDAFVTKLDPTGSMLVYSTYLGGSNADGAFGIALDASEDAVVAGGTVSPDFPTMAPYQPHCGGYVTTPTPSCPAANAFVTALNPVGNALVYSTYLGGTGGDQANAIILDASGDAYVAGQTSSNNFPITAGAFQTSYGGNTDAFAAKLSFAASKLTLAYATYLGGSNIDRGRAIALDSSGNAYVAGLTNSLNFPVAAGAAGTFQGALSGGYDGFAAKLDPKGKTLVYSTYLGGSGDDGANGIAVKEGCGSGSSPCEAYVTGFTSSCTPGQTGCPSGATGFPLANPVELTSPAYDGSKYTGNQDAFISRLVPSGCGVTFSTYLGGKNTDAGVGITVDSSGKAYVVGQTNSNDFPTVSPYQSTTGGGYDAFLTAATPGAAAATCLYSGNIASPTKLTFSGQLVGTTSTAQTVTLTNGGDAKLNISGFTVNPSQEFAETDNCVSSSPLSSGGTCTINVTFTPGQGSATNGISGNLTVNDDDSSSSNPHTVALVGTGEDFQVVAAPTKTTITAGQTTPAVTVTLTPVGGFNAMVSLSCTNLPSNASCTFQPASLNLNTSSATANLTISTIARTSGVAPRPAPYGNWPPFLIGLGFCLGGLWLLALVAMRLSGYRGPRRAWALSLLGATLLFVLVWSSCVSGSPSAPKGTPAGTYSVGVTGTSGSLVHNVAFTLTVQ